MLYSMVHMKVKPTAGDKTLESLKIFPYIAWGVTVLFAFFVYNITIELQAVTKDLQKQTIELEAKVNAPVESIHDFEN